MSDKIYKDRDEARSAAEKKAGEIIDMGLPNRARMHVTPKDCYIVNHFVDEDVVAQYSFPYETAPELKSGMLCDFSDDDFQTFITGDFQCMNRSAARPFICKRVSQTFKYCRPHRAESPDRELLESTIELLESCRLNMNKHQWTKLNEIKVQWLAKHKEGA